MSDYNPNSFFSILNNLNEKVDKIIDNKKEYTEGYIEKTLQDFIKKKISQSIEYKPKIGVFGKTGAGKSSLCNAIFGENVSTVSDVKACTREIQEIPVGPMTLLDAPGIGETIQRHAEYTALYREYAQKCDLILWVMKADDRAYAEAQEIYNNDLKGGCPVFIVISQIDKISPTREWNWDTFEPGPKQLENIAIKKKEVRDAFHCDYRHIAAVAIDEEADSQKNYNLQNLVENIISTIPNKKKASVYRQAKAEVRTEKAKETAEKGLIDYCGDALEDFVLKTVPVIENIPPLRRIVTKVKEFGVSVIKNIFSLFG